MTADIQPKRIVLVGGPGSGKTTVLQQLQQRGYATGGDAARAIIRERKTAGLSPRPVAAEFAKQILDRELVAYDKVSLTHGPLVFFERGVVDAVAFLRGEGALTDGEVDLLLQNHPYDTVFLFPPWQQIYRTDDERDHTFDHAVNVYESTRRWYAECGYAVVEVPKDTPVARADFVLDNIDER